MKIDLPKKSSYNNEKLYRCAMCDTVIPIEELCPANKYNERYCKQCSDFFKKFLNQYKELRKCQ